MLQTRSPSPLGSLLPSTASAPDAGAEPSLGTRFWLALGLVAVVTAGLHFYGLGKWSWGDDELNSLAELSLLDEKSTGAALPDMIPVWYKAQGLFLRVLPLNEWGTRFLSACCGVLTVIAAFVFAARLRGLLFAVALAVLMDGSQLLVWLSQQNRFYTMATLFLVLTLAAVWSRVGGVKMVLLSAVLGLLAVLSHNVMLVVLGLGFASACVAFLLGWVPRRVLVRSGATACAGGLLYLAYLRPAMKIYIGVWATGGTPVLVSFVAQVGMPTLALALLGAGACLIVPAERRTMGWWVGLVAGELLFLAILPRVLSVWSARYAILLVLPFWFVAAYAMERVALALGSRPLAWCWYGCVALLLLPKLASHYVDGTRHDFRQAADMVTQAVRADEPIYSEWPSNLRYYLPDHLKRSVRTWTGRGVLPAGEFLVVVSTNAWAPALQVQGRRADVLGEVARRRFDEQSHIIRVYRIGAEAAGTRSRAD